MNKQYSVHQVGN